MLILALAFTHPRRRGPRAAGEVESWPPAPHPSRCVREAGLEPNAHLWTQGLCLYPRSCNAISRLSVSWLNRLETTGFTDSESLVVRPGTTAPATRGYSGALDSRSLSGPRADITMPDPAPTAQGSRAPGRCGKRIPGEPRSACTAAGKCEAELRAEEPPQAPRGTGRNGAALPADPSRPRSGVRWRISNF